LFRSGPLPHKSQKVGLEPETSATHPHASNNRNTFFQTRGEAGAKELLGSDDISALRTVDCLGIAWYDQVTLPETEALYKRAAQGFEELIGSNGTLVFFKSTQRVSLKSVGTNHANHPLKTKEKA